MERLKFIGAGGALNFELGGNSCYLKDGDNLFIIDACEDATKKLINEGAFDNIKNVYIAITHTHYDHVAGLGTLIWFLGIYLKITPNIIYNDEAYKKTINDLLKITGVDKRFYNFIHENDLNLSFKVNMKPTPHYYNLQCYGIMFEDLEGLYYYTGDTKDIDYVKKLASDDQVKRIYCEVAEESYGVHIKYDDIKDLDKNKMVLMHFNTMNLYNKAIEDGFMVANDQKTTTKSSI